MVAFASMTIPDMANAANNLLPSFMEIGIGGLIIVAAKKWGLREPYVMIAIGVLGTLICVGMVLSSGKSIATMTIVQVAVVTGMLAVWAHIFYGTWRDARVTGSAKPMTAASASAGQQRPEAKEIQVGMIPRYDEGWGPPRTSASAQPDIGVLLRSPVGHFHINGIGIIQGVWIEFLKQPVEHWECTCVIFFHELGSAREASPLQLLLTGQDGQPELATLTATDPLPNGAGKVVYTGTARTPEMQLCLQRTMSNLAAAQTTPPPSDTYCYVEVHVAPGQRIAHQKAPIRLDYELLKHPHHGFFVPIIYKPLKSAVTFLASLQEGIQQALK